MSTLFHNILRAAASAMEIPVVICLLLLAFSVFSLGWWLAELLRERRHMNASLPRLLEAMRSGEKPLPDCTSALRESLAANLLEKEQDHYDRILKCKELALKLGPMFGLLGTLIPLGPGIITLGQGDTYTLSTSLLTAFDTTTAGENGSVLADKDHAAAMTPEEMERLQQQEGLSGGEDLEKRGEVYYDAKTGTYYIVPNAAGN